MLHFNGTLHKTICSYVFRSRPGKTHYSCGQKERVCGVRMCVCVSVCCVLGGCYDAD